MFADKTLQITILVSLAVHGLFLLPNKNFNLGAADKKEEALKVEYVKLARVRKIQKQELPRKTQFLNAPVRISADKSVPPPYIDRENIFFIAKQASEVKMDFSKPALIKPEMASVKKKITLPPVDIDKINSPSYISYYQIVREKIRRAAYQNYARTEEGEVYLTFIVSNDGSLKEVRLIDERSPANQYLKGVARQSIRNASPFPVFPKELDYPQLSFNVVISFEIE